MPGKLLRITLAIVTTVGITACTSASHSPQAATTHLPNPRTSVLPGWVVDPTVKGGFAATACVRPSNDFGVDKDQVVSLARADLAAEIKEQVRLLTRNFESKTAAGPENPATGEVYRKISNVVGQETLAESRPVKLDYVRANGRNNLCAMVVMNARQTAGLFGTVVAESGRQLDPESRRALYEEFLAHNAQSQLNKGTEDSGSN